MKKHLFAFILGFFLVLSSINAIGVYDNNGDFVYFISNPTPIINITLQSTAEVVEVDRLDVSINDIDYTTSINSLLNPGQERVLEFDLLTDLQIPDPLQTNDSVFFDLTVLDSNGNDVRPKGDPSSFEIVLDTTSPTLLSPRINESIYLIGEEHELTFEFSEEIAYASVVVNGELRKEYREESIFFQDFSKFLTLTFNSDDLDDGRNDVVVTFEDIAGNRGSQSYEVLYRGVPLEVTLLTSEDDSDLEYFFSRDYPSLFNKTIYSAVQEFTLSVETTKPASCFYSSSLLAYDSFDNVNPKKQMGTQDDLTHSIIINTVVEDRIWIACKSLAFDDDLAYLAEWMGFPGELINVRKNTGAELDIVEILPDTLVTTTPFNIDVRTTTKAACLYSFASLDNVLMDSDNLVFHQAIDVPGVNGNYNAQIRCLDVLNNQVTRSTSFTIDTNRGVKVTSFIPGFTDKSTATIKLTLSEDALCKYSTRQERASDFDTLDELTGEGLIRSFTTPTMVEGDNDFYIYCQKLNNVNMDKIRIVYDPKGPRISNLTFLHDNEPVDFLGSTDEISFEFESDSLTPIETYYVKIDLPNGTIEEEISSTQGRIRDDLTGATRLTIVAQNALGKNSTPLSKTIKFDLEPPALTIQINGETVDLLCFDTASGCKSVFYGFSNTILDCNARTFYDDNDTITIEDYNYICAKATDYVGNVVEEQKTLLAGFEILTGDSNITPINFSFIEDLVENETEDNQTPSQRSEREDLDPLEPTEPSEDEGGVNIVLILASAALLIGLSGGAYYTYRKGYLDEQLEKMGIPRAKPPVSASSGLKSGVSSAPRRPLTPAERKSKYDDHVRKLNTFIDDTLDKRNKVFNKFESGSQRGKAKNYEDTLAKRPSFDKKPEKYDEFYKNSEKRPKETAVEKKKNSVEQEAEAFERYHKTKKTSKSTKGKDSKKKKKS